MSVNYLFEMIKKKYNRINKKEKNNFRHAGKNQRYNIIDSITYNLIETMTKFKNKEIDNNNLNKDLSLNLSFILTKCNTKKRLSEDDDDTYFKQKEKYPIRNFGIYYPINRITFLEDDKINNNKNIIPNKNNNNIFFLNKKLDIFLPSSIIFTQKRQKNYLDISYNKNESKTSKNSSFLSEDSSSSKNNINLSIESIDNISEKNNSVQIKRNKKLFDYIECPLEQKTSKKNKINNFIYLLNQIDDLIETEEINKLNDIENKNFDNININNLKEDKEQNKELVNNINIINQDLLDPIYISKYLEEKLEIKNVNLENNKKYWKKMNEKYANIMQGIFIRLLKCFIENKINNKNFREIELKKIIIICFKQLLFSLGITNKNIFEKIFKSYILSDKFFSFNKFINSFDSIIFDKDFQNMKLKYLFLLNISTTQDFLGFGKRVCDEYLNNKIIKTFFELIGCNCAYKETFSDNLGQKLIKRYKAIYIYEEKNNILEGKYSLRKMRLTLESFFDPVQKYE